MTSRKKFYQFPYPKSVSVSTSDVSVARSPLFKVLAVKVLRSSALVAIMTSMPIWQFRKLFFPRLMEVPNEEIKIVYQGYGNEVHFQLDEENGVEKVFRKKEGSNGFVEEEFLGYPIVLAMIDWDVETLDHFADYLITYWDELKSEERKIHGDFTFFNILINEGGEISLIDRRDVKGKSLLYDYYLFFAYTTENLNKIFPGNLRRRVQDYLVSTLENVFHKEDTRVIEQELSRIRLEDAVGVRQPDSLLEKFKEILIPA